MSITHLNVSLCFDGKTLVPVGQLVYQAKKIWFEYDANFVIQQLAISPLKLPLKTGVQTSGDGLFQGLFGIFNDSLPDGWGRLLLDRQCRQQGLSPYALTPLDRLAYVGNQGMGALCYEPVRTAECHFMYPINLDALEKESHQILMSDTAFFEELLILNGSSGGARPKITVDVSPDKKQFSYLDHATVTPFSDFEPWLIKFSASHDPSDIGAIEWAYHLMAQHAGIEVPEAFLFSHRYFGSKRFDRHHLQRFHMHTLSGLLHADFRVPSLDYEDVLRAVHWLTKDHREVEKAYRLAVFNILTHNRDDHCKNFSFLMNSQGIWRFSPAYDVVFSYGPGGEHSTTVMGEGKNPTTSHLLALAKKCDITDPQTIIDTVLETTQQWPQFADKAGVTKFSTHTIGKIIRASR